MAFGIKELVATAQAADTIIELVPQVGDFVSHRDPLFRIYPADRHIDEQVLHQMVAIGRSRTLEQDPAFAFRIMVDIASRALSPAINDPTTAVLLSINFSPFCAMSARNSSTPARNLMGGENYGSSIERRNGRILSLSP